ncbi:MAG: histone deacetylase family protein [Panacagrimonas sp.]
MTARTLAWIDHPSCSLHAMGAGHPESPQRLAAIGQRLSTSPLADRVQRYEAPEATREQLLRAHSARHTDSIVHATFESGLRAIDGDTFQTPQTLPAVLHAAGACVLGVDLVMDGKAPLAFCAVRPPGHHAERDRATGFCFFNNVAVAAYHALDRGLSRIAILDFDVHYGNGTADIIRGDERVWMYSTYQHPLYPLWPGAPDACNLVDVPLAARTDGAALRTAVKERWLPALERQQPELILVSAGFDAHADDPLANLRWSDEDYGWLGVQIRDWAARWSEGRVVASLEGGYNINALARSVEKFLRPFAIT